jgi:hypothetical protein
MSVAAEPLFAGPLPEPLEGPFRRFCEDRPDNPTAAEADALLRQLNGFLAQ